MCLNILKEVLKYIVLLKQSVVLGHKITVRLIDQIVLPHTKYVYICKNYIMTKKSAS